MNDEYPTVRRNAELVAHKFDLPQEPEYVGMVGRNVDFGIPVHRLDKDVDLDHEYYDVSVVETKLDLPGEPPFADMTGQIVEFVIPGANLDEANLCLMQHDWCPGPQEPLPDPGTAWGGKCSDCYMEGESDV